MVTPSIHIPVLAREVIDGLNIQPGSIVVDGTLGGGGHTRLLAERVGANGLVLALDRDPAAVSQAVDMLKDLPVKPIQANFSKLPAVLELLQIPAVDGIVLDLGLSSDQLSDDSRGFSYEADGPLDLRFDTTMGEPAWQLLQHLNAERLADIIYQYGEERCSRRVARKIVERRQFEPIRTARQLAELVRSTVPRSKHHSIDPATRTFQALRIAVNDELGNLDRALEQLPACLRSGGRLAIISFHSLEDRPVKTAFRSDPRLLILTKKPIRPNQAEVWTNPRARSAKLRIAEKRE